MLHPNTLQLVYSMFLGAIHVSRQNELFSIYKNPLYGNKQICLYFDTLYICIEQDYVTLEFIRKIQFHNILCNKILLGIYIWHLKMCPICQQVLQRLHLNCSNNLLVKVRLYGQNIDEQLHVLSAAINADKWCEVISSCGSEWCNVCHPLSYDRINKFLEIRTQQTFILRLAFFVHLHIA